ncbi:MAG TPA: helix-turn-helix domain-containing protein [Ohtaekwangia sp.]|uniref:helix-turn-helix domain-containing protein n=1 Tax=Ohtaekwangia sp. TaxID=2066019 RepID=UPI002F9594D5
MLPAATSILEKHYPSPELRHVVEEYTYRCITFSAPGSIQKEMPCRAVNSLDFFLAGQYKTFYSANDESVPFTRCTIRGPRTHRKFRIEINEDFVCFSVRFKPTGIYQLFGIPMSEFCDQAVDASLILPSIINITGQLLECTDIATCIKVVEPFLLGQLARQHVDTTTVELLANMIREATSSSRIAQLYKDIPASSRNLERSFMKEVGVSPKMYSNLLRFEKVMQARKARPGEKWSAIAYDFHYFDQMHLVKDFKKFLHITPGAFQPGDFAI